MLRMFLALLMMCLSCQVSVADTLYRWVDKQGKVHYGDRPAEDAVKAERKRFADSVAEDEESLPYAVRKARQDFPVTLFLSGVCAENCKKASAYLEKRGIPYSERNFASPDETEAAKKQLGVNMIPSLKVGNTVLNGFSESQWASELDLAGYPKTPLPGTRLPRKKAENTESQAEPVSSESAQ